MLDRQAYGVDDGLDRAPAGEFLMLDAGYSHTCGVQADGNAICWGGGYGEGVAVLPGERFAWVSANHEGYNCGVRNDGSVACWEFRGGEFSQLPAPEGSFETISVEGERGCGIRSERRRELLELTSDLGPRRVSERLRRDVSRQSALARSLPARHGTTALSSAGGRHRARCRPAGTASTSWGWCTRFPRCGTMGCNHLHRRRRRQFVPVAGSPGNLSRQILLGQPGRRSALRQANPPTLQSASVISTTAR